MCNESYFRAVSAMENQRWYALIEDFVKSLFVCWFMEDLLERNFWIFRCERREASEVDDSVFGTLFEWESCDKEFFNLSLRALAISWNTCF